MQSITSSSELTELIDHAQANSLSLLMPTLRTSREVGQNAIRFKNLLKKAVQQLVKSGSSERDAEQRLASLFAKQHDDRFWQHQACGLAVYFAEGVEVTIGLHHSPEERVVVGEHFYITPLAVEVSTYQELTVLALSWDEARLYEASRNAFEAVDTDLFPVALRDVVLPPDGEDQLQFRTQQGAGGDGAMFHGQGQGEAILQADRRQFLIEVARRMESLYGTGYRSLMLVATNEVAGHLTATTDLKPRHLINASPDGLKLQQLREKVIQELDSLEGKQEWGEQLGSALAQGKATTDLSEILTAATLGRVAQLFVKPRELVWGTWDEERMRADVKDSADKIELVNLAIIKTLQAAGEIIATDEGVLANTPMAAMFRY